MSINAGLNKSFIAILFLSVVTGGILIALTTKIFPLFAAKTIYFCQQFLSNAIFPLPKSLPNSILFGFSLILALGLLSFFIQFIKTRGLIKGLLIKSVNPHKKVKEVIDSLFLTDKVYLVRDNNLFSFCFGTLSPRIIITTALINSLTGKELEAVLLHEQAHLKNYDPFKMLLGKTVASMFFFLPIFSELYKNMKGTNEILADHFVITSQKETTFLKEALRKILEHPQIRIATVPAIANPDSLEIRVHKLVNPSLNYSFRISLLNIVTSATFFIMSWFILQTPVSAFQMEHSMSMDPSYFVCSTDNACNQKCQENAKTTITTPEHLFSSQPLKYGVSSYKYK